MKKIIAFICLVCINIPVISSECGSIVKRGFIYYCGETKLTKANDIRSALSECPAACDQFETGYNLGIGGSIFVGIGGGCIGYNLGRMIGSGQRFRNHTEFALLSPSELKKSYRCDSRGWVDRFPC